MSAIEWLSLAPPVVAIALAIATRRVIVPLAIGIFVGALIFARGDPFRATAEMLETHLWASLIAPDHLRVFAFTLLMGAMVGVIHRTGGMHGVVDRLLPLARTRRGGQLITWALGLVIFFDDYANTLLLGGTMRPLTDRLKISREKLAYLVDSTAAPVAGLALVSTWIAYEIGCIDDGLEKLSLTGASVDGFSLFIASIPYRFYVLWALVMVALVAATGRDFGPMLSAERRAAAGGRRSKGDDQTSKGRATLEAPDVSSQRCWLDAAVPIGVTLAVVVCLLIYTGIRSLPADAPERIDWVRLLGNGDSYLSLVYGALAGLIAAVLMALPWKTVSLGELQEAAMQGARLMLPALAILWLAWGLSNITSRDFLATGDSVAGLLRGAVAPQWMPTIVFLLASGVAFATGTSWGTMGILMPLTLSVTFELLATGSGSVSGDNPLLIASVGSVLAGAIFGDHCSPISDTTVLSSQASGCDHIAHVRTQLPYALFVGAFSVLFGTLPIGWGVSVWIMLPVGLAAMIASFLVVGRRLDE